MSVINSNEMRYHNSAIEQRLLKFKKISLSLYFELRGMFKLSEILGSTKFFQTFLDIVEKLDIPKIEWSHLVKKNNEVKELTEGFKLEDEIVDRFFKKELEMAMESRRIRAMGFRDITTFYTLLAIAEITKRRYVGKFIVGEFLSLLRIATEKPN